MKWRYDKKHKQWYTEGWLIAKVEKNHYQYVLKRTPTFRVISSFRKLSSAKKVAQLIEEG